MSTPTKTSPFGWALRHAGEGVSPGLVKVVWLSSGGRAERLVIDKVMAANRELIERIEPMGFGWVCEWVWVMVWDPLWVMRSDTL